MQTIKMENICDSKKDGSFVFDLQRNTLTCGICFLGEVGRIQTFNLQQKDLCIAVHDYQIKQAAVVAGKLSIDKMTAIAFDQILKNRGCDGLLWYFRDLVK